MRQSSIPAEFKYFYNNRDYFPIIPIIAYSQNKKFKIHALIDSGATISVFKEEVASRLGINIDSGKEIFLGGVGGYIKGYIHKVTAEIAGKKNLASDSFFPGVFSILQFTWAGRVLHPLPDNFRRKTTPDKAGFNRLH